MTDRGSSGTRETRWRQAGGAPLDCENRIQVLDENWAALRAQAQEAFEIAILMGCGEDEARRALAETLEGLVSPVKGTDQNR